MEHFFGEGNPDNEYNRKIIKVQLLDNGKEELANAYIYNAKDRLELKQNNPYIKNGDWRSFLEKKQLQKKALA